MNIFHYCPIGEPQRKLGVYITGAGRELTLPNEPYPHAYHSSEYYFTWDKGRALADWEFQLLYIRNGKGVIEFTRGKPIPVTAGTVIILHPGEWHRYRPDRKTGWEEAYIGIGGAMVERIVSKPFFSIHPTVIRLQPNGLFEHQLDTLVGEIQSRNADHPYTLGLRTLTLIASLCETMRTYDARDAHNVAIRQAHVHIAHHLAEAIDFADLARSLGMGYALFRKRFAAYTGMAPLEFQLALRCRRATNLLASSDAPIEQIAADLGFKSAAYFSRFFRKETGQSPMQYRRGRGIQPVS